MTGQAAVAEREYESLRALVLAPVGRDTALIVEALSRAGIFAEGVAAPSDLVAAVSREIQRDGAPELGVLVVTDGALGVDWSARLADVLDCQPPWSDLPIVLLSGSLSPVGDRRWADTPYVGALAEKLTLRGSMTVLDRPIRMAALVSAVCAALNARARQTEVKELIEARDRALDEATRADRAKNQFLAFVSHELRTPLNAIGGYVQLLQMGVHGPLSAPQNEALHRVDLAQQHILGIINTLLDYARIESGRLEYLIEPVSLREIIDGVKVIIDPQLAAKDLRFETRVPDEPAIVAADGEKVRHILLNLLSNAMKFTARGGTIAVELEADDGVSGEARVHVADSGIGIPADKLEAIFEPFVQAHHDRWMEGQRGTGLGLAISREMARGMGGDLTATSAPGSGSRFTLTLNRSRPSVRH